MSVRPTLRFLTCGHVDDGKSTLIGRLLHEVGAVPPDQWENALVDGAIDFARLTDGLEDERTQGITIDVACRYFRHAGRHYRISDTPGHVQYVRNMAVAAAGCDCALIVVDASHGVREQTIRHSRIASFFGIDQFVVVVNKMDLVDYDQARFREIEAVYREMLGPVVGLSLTFIPASAIHADNVVAPSARTPWYRGPSIMEYLDALEAPRLEEIGVRLPVQFVVRIGERRGYQGMLGGGTLQVGDRLGIAGGSLSIAVSEIYHSGRAATRALPGQSITVVPAEDVDLSRGNVLHALKAPVEHTDAFDADWVWLEAKAASGNAMQGILKVHHREVQAEVQIRRAGDPVSEARVFTASSVAMDTYAAHRATGLFLFIDRDRETVVAVGTVRTVHAGENSYMI